MRRRLPGVLIVHPAKLLLVACGAAPTREDSKEAPQIAHRAAAPIALVLEDQTGGSWPIADMLEAPCFLIVGGSSSSERSTRWDLEVVGPLAQRLGWGVHRIVCLSGYPRLFHKAVAARIRTSARPPGVPILLDWDDAVARWLDCPVDNTTVVVLDAGGVELGRVSGDLDATAGERLGRLVDREPASRRNRNR